MSKCHRPDTDLDMDSPYRNILSPVSSLKGVGRVIAGELRKRGVQTVYDLLYVLPRSYQDRRKFVPIHEVSSNKTALIKDRILEVRRVRLRYRAMLEARRRLGVIEKTTDGFRIAEEDLAIRGPGEFLGERQSGFYQFRVANLMRDTEILSEAREDAFRLVEGDPKLAYLACKLLRQMFRGGQMERDEFVEVA